MTRSALLILALFSLAACENDDDDEDDDDDSAIASDSGDTSSSGTDVDLDGYDATEDCDDTDADVNPGATEVPYDGVDNDCDDTTVDVPCGDGILGQSETCDSCPADCTEVVIDFDALTDGDAVTTQFSGVTFSAEQGSEVGVTSGAGTFNTSEPNFICTRFVGGAQNCADDFSLQFTAPASNVRFSSVGIEADGTAAFSVRMHLVAGGTTEITVLGAGESFVPVLVDLSTHGAVNAVDIFDVVDGNGVGFDDFSFTTQ
ncbi:MAG: putative metal-binding motif-containing protein [Proteobacteria bacterium]|nr:putative metal-binding motif-containing protein [Pseudomonadota bacterium]